MQLCEYFKLPLRNIQKPKGENIMTDNKKTERNVAIVIHVCIWTYIFAFPLLYGRREDSVDWLSYFQRLYFPISSCLVFYANYFYFCSAPAFGREEKGVAFRTVEHRFDLSAALQSGTICAASASAEGR